MANIKNNIIYDYVNAISDRTHPSPEEDSRFYRKDKPEIFPRNPNVTYGKRRGKLSKQK